MRKIELDAPNIGNIEKKYVADCLNSGFVSTYGPYVPEFESQFSRFLGGGCCISTQSGTSSIHLALYDAGISRGDEVLVPALTFVASVNPVKYVGAAPVFIDAAPDTWLIDLNSIEKKISSRTKAIIIVDLYGNIVDRNALTELKEKYNLIVIEDSTEALGGMYDNKYVGTFGDYGCFSFNGNKLLTTGGGGMLWVKDKTKAAHLKFLANQARAEKKGYFHPELGFNYRMTNLEASLGLAQLSRIGDFIRKKIRFNEIYREKLSYIEELEFQVFTERSNVVPWLTVVKFQTHSLKEKIKALLNKAGIPTRDIFNPIVDFPMYKEKGENHSVARNIFERGLCLPSSTHNSERDIMLAANKIKSIFKTGSDLSF